MNELNDDLEHFVTISQLEAVIDLRNHQRIDKRKKILAKIKIVKTPKTRKPVTSFGVVASSSGNKVKQTPSIAFKLELGERT